MVEYLEDAIELDPSEALPAQVLKNGVQFRGTGDKLIDRWEQQIAEGKTPNFTEAASGEDKDLLEAWLKPKKKKPKTPEPAPPKKAPEPAAPIPEPEEFHDSYKE